ncbi:MAG: HipA N-terminal domain-containing protein [Lentimicrobium sp.]|jgi:serine/threonine-protein kinase HipA|uniref:HipA N-terminal domain-containing protein n=1 Tax=Lentimicrobium sp. TaxID=2034841 RepID=UPI0025D04A9D|nr:HipA N-terminal domain-containing protein [Lentimicrobium sp.]MCO5257968.1 HipA N-terminal domain-containing protein [Lentimicrobium sp.]
MRKAEIKIRDITAGWLTRDEKGYRFEYDPGYLRSKNPEPVSLTLPLQAEPFTGKVLFPFFDGLIPEGWLLEIAEKNWKLNPRDRMGLLMACCKDCIGVVSVNPVMLEDEP